MPISYKPHRYLTSQQTKPDILACIYFYKSSPNFPVFWLLSIRNNAPKVGSQHGVYRCFVRRSDECNYTKKTSSFGRFYPKHRHQAVKNIPRQILGYIVLLLFDFW
jgi:hypothetical protein